MKPTIIDVHSSLVAGVGELAIKREQEIPDEFLKSLAEDRADTGRVGRSEFYRVASIPVAFIEKWLREGFDAFKAPPKDIIKRLRNEGLDKFILGNV